MTGGSNQMIGERAMLFTTTNSQLATMMPVAVLLLACFTASGQDVPPPPKPPDDGPSLADTMKFIEEKLGSIGPVNYIAYLHDNTTGNDGANKFAIEATNVRASAVGCRIDYHARLTRDDNVLYDQDAWFPLKALQEVVVTTEEQHLKLADSKAGHPEKTARVDPLVFTLEIKGKFGERSFGQFFNFYDESLANRVAKALVHAVELCGGGNKDPF